MHDKNEIELHWLMQTKYFWKIPIIKKKAKEKEKEKRKDPVKFQREKCSGRECSYTKHDLHLHNNNQDLRGFNNSASKQGWKKKTYAKFTLDPTKPPQKKEEKKIEKKNLSPGDGFSSGIV
jgi:hypothetical protein